MWCGLRTKVPSDNPSTDSAIKTTTTRNRCFSRLLQSTRKAVSDLKQCLVCSHSHDPPTHNPNEKNPSIATSPSSAVNSWVDSLFHTRAPTPYAPEETEPDTSPLPSSAANSFVESIFHTRPRTLYSPDSSDFANERSTTSEDTFIADLSAQIERRRRHVRVGRRGVVIRLESPLSDTVPEGLGTFWIDSPVITEPSYSGPPQRSPLLRRVSRGLSQQDERVSRIGFYDSPRLRTRRDVNEHAGGQQLISHQLRSDIHSTFDWSSSDSSSSSASSTAAQHGSRRSITARSVVPRIPSSSPTRTPTYSTPCPAPGSSNSHSGTATGATPSLTELYNQPAAAVTRRPTPTPHRARVPNFSLKLAPADDMRRLQQAFYAV